jgi:branched-chain amino acid transport system permease protein
VLDRLRKRPRLTAFLLAVLLAALPFIMGFGLGNSWVRVLDFVLLYVLLAIGLNIVVGYAGLLDLGYIAFYAIGAYLYAWLASPHFGLHLPFWLVLPLGAMLAGLFGVLLGSPTLRLRGDYLAIVTLGFGEIIRIFMNNLNAPFNLTNGPQGINLIDPISVAGFSFGKPLQLFGMTLPPTYFYYYLFLAFTLLAIFVALRLQDSRIGRAWAAIREDEVAAAAMGINTRNMKLLAFAMGATFGGLAGGLFAAFQGFISPESFNLWESILVLCMIVLGGMGNIPGVILGAVLLTVIPEALRYLGDLQRTMLGHVAVDPSDLAHASVRRCAGGDDVVPACRTAAFAPAQARVRRRRCRGRAGTGRSLRRQGMSEAYLLSVNGVTKRFGGLAALETVSLGVRAGEIYGLIGPNGAGKTTLFNCMTGLYSLTAGEVLLAGRPLQGLKPHQIVERGFARTFQNIRLFANMTALENVMVGRHARSQTGILGAVLRNRRARAEERDIRDRAHRLMEFIGLGNKARTLACHLSYGDQRRLEIARALATEPKLLALDEPVAGMNPSERRQMADLFQRVRDSGVTLLLIEHDVKLVMGLCDRVAVLDYGRKIAEGDAASVQRDEAVIAAYLGGATA